MKRGEQAKKDETKTKIKWNHQQIVEIGNSSWLVKYLLIFKYLIVSVSPSKCIIHWWLNMCGCMICQWLTWRLCSVCVFRSISRVSLHEECKKHTLKWKYCCYRNMEMEQKEKKQIGQRKKRIKDSLFLSKQFINRVNKCKMKHRGAWKERCGFCMRSLLDIVERILHFVFDLFQSRLTKQIKQYTHTSSI